MTIMAAPPNLPSRRFQPLKLVYKILTDKFVCSSYPIFGSARWMYSTEISVEKQWDYPDIPPAIWAVQLLIESSNGAITASVTPNNSAMIARPTNGVLVNSKIWTIACGPFDVLIGGDGWMAPRNDTLDSLIESYRDTNGQQRFRLRKAVDIYVTLTFYAKKLPSRADLHNLLGSRTLTDCTLICEGHEFPAHRAILAANSPVFAAMFQDEMQEKASGVCKIEGTGRDVLEMILKFVYSRASLEDADRLEELWMAADKYDIKDLCAECERIMMQSVKPENAVKYFDFARDRGLKELMVIAVKVIAEQSLEIE